MAALFLLSILSAVNFTALARRTRLISFVENASDREMPGGLLNCKSSQVAAAYQRPCSDSKVRFGPRPGPVVLYC
jgi:hypothetical protein